MPTKIFVGNIAPGTTSSQLSELFKRYGAVTECDVLGLGNYGFVHMANESDGVKAIEGLNGYHLNGSDINVEKSTRNTQGRGQRAVAGRGGTGGVRGSHSDSNTRSGVPRRNTTKIFVGNLKTGVTDDELRKLFEPYGTVTEANVCGGFGFVHMANEAEAKHAMSEVNGRSLRGGCVNVELSTKETQGRSSGDTANAGYDASAGSRGSGTRGAVAGGGGGARNAGVGSSNGAISSSGRSAASVVVNGGTLAPPPTLRFDQYSTSVAAGCAPGSGVVVVSQPTAAMMVSAPGGFKYEPVVTSQAPVSASIGLGSSALRSGGGGGLVIGGDSYSAQRDLVQAPSLSYVGQPPDTYNTYNHFGDSTPAAITLFRNHSALDAQNRKLATAGGLSTAPLTLGPLADNTYYRPIQIDTSRSSAPQPHSAQSSSLALGTLVDNNSYYRPVHLDVSRGPSSSIGAPPTMALGAHSMPLGAPGSMALGALVDNAYYRPMQQHDAVAQARSTGTSITLGPLVDNTYYRPVQTLGNQTVGSYYEPQQMMLPRAVPMMECAYADNGAVMPGGASRLLGGLYYTAPQQIPTGAVGYGRLPTPPRSASHQVLPGHLSYSSAASYE